MMLYKTMLSVGFGDNGVHSSRYFLYSKYEPQQGLIREGASMSDEQTKTVMAIRNSIVHDQFRYTNPAELRQDLLSWNAEEFRQREVSDRLWQPYSKPELDSVLLPIQMADQLTQAYFLRCSLSSFEKTFHQESGERSMAGKVTPTSGTQATKIVRQQER